MRRVMMSLTAVGMLASCSGTKEEPKTLKIGVIISQTGAYGERGPERLQGAQLAAAEINAKGGVLGQQIELVTRDDGTDAATAEAKAHELVDTVKVPAIIGASASRATIGASKVTIPAKVVQISGSSTSPAITALADDGYVNRTCPSDALQGKLLAEQAKAKSFTKVAVLYTPGDAYAEGLANAFADSFTALGGTVTKVEVTTGKTSYQDELTTAYNATPDALLLSVYPPEGIQVMKDYLAGFTSHNSFWFYPDSLIDEAFITGVGTSKWPSIQHEGTAPGAPRGAKADAFVAAYTAKFGAAPHPDSFAANFYDATYLVALAIEAAGKAEGPAIKDALRGVSRGKADGAQQVGPADYQAAVTKLHAGGDINYEGASGSVDLDTSGDPVAPYDIWQVQNGAVTVTQAAVNP